MCLVSIAGFTLRKFYSNPINTQWTQKCGCFTKCSQFLNTFCKVRDIIGAIKYSLHSVLIFRETGWKFSAWNGDCFETFQILDCAQARLQPLFEQDIENKEKKITINYKNYFKSKLFFWCVCWRGYRNRNFTYLYKFSLLSA